MAYLQALYEYVEFTNEGVISSIKAKIKESKERKDTVVYDCSTKKSSSYNGSSYGYAALSANKSIKDAIKKYICNIYHGSLDEKGNVIFNKESDNKSLEKDNKYVYIQKIKRTYDKNSKNFHFKDLEVAEEGELVDLIKKHSIKIEVHDNSAIKKRRIKMYQDAVNIAKQVLAELSKQDPAIKRGFEIVKYENEYDDFINNIEHLVAFMSYDAWAYTNNRARDDAEYEKFNTALYKIYSELSNRITFSSVDLDGDWDDGSIDLVP